MTSPRRYRHLLRAAFIVSIVLVKVSGTWAQQDDASQSRLSALAMEQKGQNGEAETLWSAILGADPRNVEALAHMGLLEARQEHYGAAIDFYRRAMATDASYPGLEMNLGLALFKAGQFPDAVRTFASEIRKHPGDQRLTILLGMAHYGMKDYLVAIPYLQRALQHDERNSTLHTALARSCMLSKQYQCVLDEQTALLALHSESADVDLLTGEALQELDRPEEAIRELKTALQSNPNEPNLHFALGLLLWSISRYSEAANEFQLDLQNNSDDARGHIYLADCLLREKQTAKALGELNKVAASHDSQPLMHLDLGIIYMDSGRMDDALRELEIASDSDPDNAELHRRIAKLYQSMGKKVEANNEFESASRMSQTHPSLQEMLEPVAP